MAGCRYLSFHQLYAKQAVSRSVKDMQIADGLVCEDTLREVMLEVASDRRRPMFPHEARRLAECINATQASFARRQLVALGPGHSIGDGTAMPMSRESLRQRMAESAAKRIASETGPRAPDAAPVADAENKVNSGGLSDGATDGAIAGVHTGSDSRGDPSLVTTGEPAVNSAQGSPARVDEWMAEDRAAIGVTVDCMVTAPVLIAPTSGSADSSGDSPMMEAQPPSADPAPLRAVQIAHGSLPHHMLVDGEGVGNVVGALEGGIDERLSSFRRALGQLRQESRATPSTPIDAKSLEVLALQTLQTYLRNCLDRPGEERYRRINLSNRALQQRLGQLPSALGVLKAAGFYEDETGQLVLRRDDPGLLWLGISLIDDAIAAAQC